MKFWIAAFAVIAAGAASAQTPAPKEQLPFTRVLPPLQVPPNAELPREFLLMPDPLGRLRDKPGLQQAPEGKVCLLKAPNRCDQTQAKLFAEPFQPGTAQFYMLEKKPG